MKFNAPLAVMIVFMTALSACVGPQPRDDYNLAWAAIKAAKTAQAPKYAPGLWSKAEEYYRQALQDYEERDYTNAKANFRRAQRFAENAENYTMLKKAETGVAD